ncbi:hypothetical protein RJ641_010104 [Dillenia turbinata]|uniref:Uncharacterized protein n=1 Tax=Dillenia turbinata TaxID=194707 RepID=A0AAN8UZV9_9MAGN
MEKKKDHIASTSQETDTHDHLNKEGQEPPLVPPTDMLKQDYPNSSNKEHAQILQWSSTTQQPIMEHYPFPSISCSSPQQQLKPTVHHVQHSDLSPNLAQPTLPFWLPPRTGYPFSGTNVPGICQLFTPNGTTCGEKLAANRTHVPNFCYHIGYPFPGFPGPWDPSACWNHTPQPRSPCAYTFPGARGYNSQPVLPVPSYPVAFGQTAQKGIIRPHIKLSHKHQLLWEAQSAENAHLWSVIGQLQSEVAEYKSKLLKLEAQVCSLRPTTEVHVAQGTKVASTGQAPKRGRPRKSVAAVTQSPLPNESLHRSCGKKAVKNRRQGKISEHNFENEAIDKVEEKGKSYHSSGNIRKENDGDNPKAPALENHGLHIIPEVHANLACPNTLEVESSVYKRKDTKISTSNGIKQGGIMVCRWNYAEDAYTLEDGTEAKRDDEEMEDDASSDTENCTSQA